jgi:hypothetical protein
MFVRGAAVAYVTQRKHKQSRLLVGNKDQYIKSVFAEETEALTRRGLRFSVPPETKTTELRVDGLLTLQDHTTLQALPPPWSLAQGDEVLLEFKMQGDKTGTLEIERALLRRQAWQVHRVEKNAARSEQVPLWIVAAQLPGWLRENRLIESPAGGCYRLEPHFSHFYFVAANELPLLPELLPFLVARSGKFLVQMVSWMRKSRPDLLLPLLKGLTLEKQQLEEIVEELLEPDLQEQMRRERLYYKAIMSGSYFQEEVLPQLRQEGRQEERLELLTKQFAKRLKREMKEEEKAALASKLDSLGPDRLSDVLFALAPDALLPWLLDSNAR